jgi:predicted deacylase
LRRKTLGGTIFTDIDFDAPGKQIGTLNLPYSVHDDAWGVIPIPIAVIRGSSDGPTVFLDAAIHGDEYEGPIVLNELIRSLTPADIRGRLIVMPCANAPALRAASRVGPHDGLNMARVFPGDHWGSPTRQIAACIHETLFPLADYYVDLHSGGSSLFIEESAQVIVTPQMHHDVRKICHEMARWFGAKWTVVTSNMGDPRTSCGAAVNAGIPCIAAEMGSNGSISPYGVGRTRQAVQRLLAHLGVLHNVTPCEPPPTRSVEIVNKNGNLLCPANGFFEPFIALGDTVSQGQPAGMLHQLDDPAQEPRTVFFKADGLVYSMRTFGRANAGNSLAVLVRDREEISQ